MPSYCDYCLSEPVARGDRRAYVDAPVTVHTVEGDLHLCQHHATQKAEKLAAAEAAVVDFDDFGAWFKQAPAPKEPQMRFAAPPGAAAAGTQTRQPPATGSATAAAMGITTPPGAQQIPLPGDGPMDHGAMWWPESKGSEGGEVYGIVHARTRGQQATCWLYAPDEQMLMEALMHTGPEYAEVWPTRVVWAELHAHPDDGRFCARPARVLVAAFRDGKQIEGPRQLP